MSIVNGTPGNDTINTSNDDDSINGGAGDDSIYAGNGNDTIRGGAGNDTIDSGNGLDVIIFGSGDGNDAIDRFETAQDIIDLRFPDVSSFANVQPLMSQVASDTVITFADGSTIRLLDINMNDLTAGNFTFSPPPDGIVTGTGGNDSMGSGYTDAGGDQIDGSDGNDDSINGGAGNDTINAGVGNDTILGGAGNDSLSGGADADTFVIQNGPGNDTIFGGETGTDNDTIDLSQLSGPVTVDYWAGGENGRITSGADTIRFYEIESFTGTNFNDSFLAGADTAGVSIDGGLGNDSVYAGSGNDTISGGEGADDLWGGSGNDLIHGGAGNDSLGGNEGDDTVHGDDGADTVEGRAGNDLLTGGDGNDLIDGGDDDDTIDGDAGDDTLDGGSGSDSILGGDGDDVFERSGGNNTLDGGAGSDFFEIGLGNDTVIGGETGSDQDTLSIADSNDAIDITFTGDAVGTYLDGDGDSGAFSQIEVFELSDNADSVDGTADATGFSVLAGSGADTIIGGAGNDTIAGGDGDDYIEGGAGDDVLTTGLGQDTLVGGEGNDTLMNSDGDDLLIGGAGDDSIVATGGQDTLVGGTGADTMEGGDDADTFIIEDSFGNDVIIGGEGTTDPSDADYDTIDLSQLTGPVTVTYTGDDAGTITDGTDTITFSEIERVILTERADLVDASSDIAGTQIVAGDGDDTVIGGAGSDTIDAGAGADTVQGEDGADEIYGGSGNDTLFGNRGSDTLYGGDGDDSIEGGNAGDWGRGSGDNASSHDFVDGGAGNDTIGGGDGDDTIFGGAGDDIINGNNGDDVLDGGDDADTFVISHSGNDTIVGGEGGNDDDVIDLSQLSGPVTVTYTGDEAGTITDGTDTITFSEIERFILTEFDDSIVGYWGGAHSISGGGGSDTIYGGMGADTIDGGDGADSVWGEDGDDTLLGGAGDDTIGGMAGNDSLEGGEGNDSLRGGGGADTLLGGEGADTLIAGADSDVLDGGAGNDLLTGGDGNDTFTYSVGSGSDTITDFNFGNTGSISDGNGTNNDFIDLSAFYDDIWELHADQADDGILNQSNNGVGGADYSDNAQFGSGSLTFSGASADNTSFTSENTSVVCYAPGTLIDTPTGPRAVETLRPGDLVTTLDHGAQPIRWTRSGEHPLEEVEVEAKPVQIKAGALGHNLPTHDLIVSSQHRIFVGGAGQLHKVFASEAFAPAKSLTAAPGIRHMKGKTKITWVHFACDRHEVVTANGCLSESLLLGPMVMNGLSPAERRALTDMFGPAPTPDTALNGPPARDCLTVGAVKRQIAKHLKEKGQLVTKEIKKWDRDLAMEKYEAERMREALTMARAS